MKPRKDAGVAIILIVLVGFIVAVSLIALLWNANRILKSRAESYLGKNFSIENISAGWGKIVVTNLIMKDTLGKEVGKTEKIVISADFLDFIRKKYSISEIRIMNPQFLIETDPKGKILLPIITKDQRMEKHPSAKKEGVEKTPLFVKRARIINGSIDYIDRGTKGSPAIIKLRNVDLELKNLSYPFSEDLIFFNIEAQILGHDSKGKLTSTGKTNLLSKDTSSIVKIKNLDAKILEPYCRKTRDDIRIKTGFLDIDMKIDILSRKIDAPCKVVIKDLQIAQTSNIKRRILDETVKSALSILKNERGEIVLNFVVTGNLDDPDFNIKEAIMKGILKSLGQKLGIFMLGTIQKDTV